MISGSNLEIVDQSSEDREEQQTESKTNVNATAAVNSNNNTSLNVGKSNKEKVNQDIKTDNLK